MRLPDQLKETPSQTAGPYVHIGCFPRMCGIEVFEHEIGADMVSEATKGERIEIRGTVRPQCGQGSYCRPPRTRSPVR